ncbi:hypothetical protein EBQ90_09835 [bacterium]|nr:hypothetical protein [bacterium]
MKHPLIFSLSILLVSGTSFSIDQHQSQASAPKTRETVKSEKEDKELLATLGADTSPSGYRKLFIFSSEKLTEVEYKVGAAENWSRMNKATSPTHEAFGTESFLPSAPGQKYTVRGIRPDGTRVTTLLEVDPKDGKVISTKIILEESKEAVDAERKLRIEEPSSPSTPSYASNTGNDQSFASSAVLMRAQSNIGRCLGNGTCAALAGGSRVGQISGGGNYHQVQPGQVLRFSPGSSFSSSMGRFTVSSQGHYVVVESVNPDGSFTFLHQNWAGGSSHGQTVRRDTGNLRTLNGSATIYTGN